jgi:hypothetical protein
MRATEVELETVGPGVFGSLDDIVPGCALGFHHERGDHGVVRIAVFDLGDFTEVDFDRPVADKFDVVETHHAVAVEID